MLAVQNAPARSSFDAVAGAFRGGRPRSQTITRTVKVGPQQGLHLRPCSAIVSTVGKHQADLIVQKGVQSARAASIFELLSLAASPGTELVLSATGAEAQEAVDAVAGLFASDFQGS
jgi:phosphotransferase system HPr (HPr) family protein